MSPTTIILGAAIIYGVFLLLGLFFKEQKPRTAYLKKMRDLMEGQLEPLEKFPNSYKLSFVYQGIDFVFE